MNSADNTIATVPDAGKIDNPRDVWELPEYAEDANTGAPVQHGIQLPVFKFDGGTGEFVDSDGDTYSYKEGVAIVPVLALGTSRLYWRKGVRLPVCGSDNNREPWEEIDLDEIAAGPFCMNCQYGQWEDGVAPECNEVHNYAIMLADDAKATLHVLSVRGNSIKPMRNVWGQLPKKRPVYGNIIRLTAERREAGSNRYFVIEANLTGGYPAAELAPLYKSRYETAKQYAIPDRAALQREQREQQKERRAAHMPDTAPLSQGDLPFTDVPQIGEPNTMIFEPGGQRRMYGVDGRIEPVISEAQREYIDSLCATIELDSDQIGGLVVEMFGSEGAADLADLCASEASAMIERLKVVKAELKKAAPKTKTAKPAD